MNKNLISVIVPVYNVEKYLDECVQGIVNQSYSKLEIFLVDDGSTDRSSEICDEWQRKDARITVIHKENGGLSDARNVAIDLATGEYLTFIDSDDVIDQDYVEILCNTIIENNCDISVCNMSVFYDDATIIKVQNHKQLHVELFAKQEALREMLLEKKFGVSACAKMYRACLFNKIRYPKGMLYEDLGTTYKIVDKVSNVGYIPSNLYYYRQRRDSITKKEFNKKTLDILIVFEGFYNTIETSYPTIVKYAKYRDARICVGLLEKIIYSSRKDKNLIILLKKRIRKNLIIVLSNKRVGLGQKVKILSGSYSVFLLKILHTFYMKKIK